MDQNVTSENDQENSNSIGYLEAVSMEGNENEEQEQQSEVKFTEPLQTEHLEQLEESEVVETELAPESKQSQTTSKMKPKLVTLNAMSICQFCQQQFDSQIRIPLLLPCGHFFCKTCIETELIDEEGRIVCPDDESAVENGDDLKVLSNFTNNKVTNDVGK